FHVLAAGKIFGSLEAAEQLVEEKSAPVATTDLDLGCSCTGLPTRDEGRPREGWREVAFLGKIPCDNDASLARACHHLGRAGRRRRVGAGYCKFRHVVFG